MHVAVPLFFLLYWFFFVPKGSLNWIHPFLWLIYPLVYLFYSLLRGEFPGFHACPFINTTEPGYDTVLLNSIRLMILFIVTGLLLVVADKKMGEPRVNNLCRHFNNKKENRIPVGIFGERKA